jgi:ABC-type polysaccharide/polyol phosphate transport system ATPase subunit
MIKLRDVHVNIPVFLNDYSRAIRTSLGERIFGGRLSAGHGGKLCVNALRGVSLDVGAGERVGLLGRNGAGKTTLLRVIAGIVPVSSGKVEVEGQVRSFFNLGAGLDPTRSGLSNIQSMSMFYVRDRKIINETTPAIVEFAELGDFIHMPVYTYSAGMQARLMVAVATAYGGDVIVFDEMLAAGDTSFIGKVEKRLRDMLSAARCVVVASHSAVLLKKLCDRALWIDDGRVRAQGAVGEVNDEYERAMR